MVKVNSYEAHDLGYDVVGNHQLALKDRGTGLEVNKVANSTIKIQYRSLNTTASFIACYQISQCKETVSN